jgi:integrase
MLFRVYSRYVPNLTRRDGSAFERMLTGAMGNGERQINISEEIVLTQAVEVSHD